MFFLWENINPIFLHFYFFLKILKTNNNTIITNIKHIKYNSKKLKVLDILYLKIDQKNFNNGIVGNNSLTDLSEFKFVDSFKFDSLLEYLKTIVKFLNINI